MNQYSVLIIDDNALDRYLLKRQLATLELDITVFEQEDGASALAFLGDYSANRNRYPSNFPPMILFLDITMPITDGWGFLQKFSELRTTQSFASSFVAMFTTSDREEDRANAARYPFVHDYLVKGLVEADRLQQLFTRYSIATDP